MNQELGPQLVGPKLGLQSCESDTEMWDHIFVNRLTPTEEDNPELREITLAFKREACRYIHLRGKFFFFYRQQSEETQVGDRIETWFLGKRSYEHVRASLMAAGLTVQGKLIDKNLSDAEAESVMTYMRGEVDETPQVVTDYNLSRALAA